MSRFRCDVYSDESNDVESIYRLTREALAKARKDLRPVFMNIKCCRHLEHVGIHPDWDFGYRTREECRWWLENDSLIVQRRRLLDQGMSEAEITAVETEIDHTIQRSVERAKAAPHPALERLYHGVFYEKN